MPQLESIAAAGTLLGSGLRFAAMFAEYNSDPYKILVVIHILSAILVFGLALAYHALAKGSPEQLKRTHNTMVLPGLLVSFLTGAALVGMSDKLFEMSQSWVIISEVVWLVAGAIALIPLRTAIAKLAAGDDSARKQVSMFTGIYHLCLTVIVVCMVFKFGFDQTV